MITLLPMAKASLGLSITRDSICLVETQRTWGKVKCRKISEQLLSPDLLRLSPARPNIGNPKEFVQCLSAMVKHLPLPQSVALSLPDLCARTTVLTFSSFPTKKTEQDSIVRWKFQQDMNINPDNTRFSYRTFPLEKTQSGPLHILATAVQHDIIEQYEQACLEVGLLPNSVGLAGLDVFDFYRSHFREFSRRSRSHKNEIGSECMFLYLANWGFSFMAFRQDHPTFLRVKALPISRANQENTPADEANPSTHSDRLVSDDEREISPQNEKQYSPAQINIVTNELVATLQYYFESLHYPREEHTPISLYFAEGLRNGENLLPTDQTIKNLLNVSMSHPPPLTIIPFADMLAPKIKSMITASSPQMDSISALAGVTVLT